VNTHTKTDPDAIRKELLEILHKRERGDLNERSFQRAFTERTVDLFKVIVSQRLAQNEAILQEHHVIRSHFKVTQPVIKEPEQLATSLFATDRRLIRLRCMIQPNAPVRCDETDRTMIDKVPYDRIESLKMRRQVRSGEIGVGLTIAALAFIFQSMLQITGVFMVGLGLLGALHGALLPTRWIEVITIAPENPDDPILIHALRKKSARQLRRLLREKTGLA
jgi:hypothetical protein